MVRRGDTLWRISQRYGVSVEDVARANQIDDVRQLEVGTRLWIPEPRDVEGERTVPALPEGTGRRAAPDAELERSLRELDIAFAWPVQGELNSSFGGRRGDRHDGIDIGARKGSPVTAAEAGHVVFGDELGSYGRVVILRHGGDWSTVYAHNDRIRVREGQLVVRGQVIAEVGRSGNASGPHLHFEIRYRQTPVDPLRYLPSG